MVSLNQCIRPRHVGTLCDTQEGILEWGLLGLVRRKIDGKVETKSLWPAWTSCDAYDGILEWGLVELGIEKGLVGGVPSSNASWAG